MIYQVQAQFFFALEDEANDFFHDCQVAIAKAITINPGQPNEQRSTASNQLCFHDLTPPGPCTIVEEIHTT